MLMSYFKHILLIHTLLKCKLRVKREMLEK